jgi:glycosyltransferase involved in cell wall biosynthesis
MSSSSELRVLFVCQNDFSAPTEKQVVGFAQGLIAAGHRAMISVGGNATTADAEGFGAIPGLEIHEHRFEGRRLRRSDLDAAASFGPTLVHAFNSRVPVIAAARQYADGARAPVFAHFEDDEWHLPDYAATDPLRQRIGHHARRVLYPLHPPLWWHSSRASLAWTRRYARALDALTPALARHVRARLERECTVLLPVLPTLNERTSAAPADHPFSDEVGRALPEAPFALFTGTVWPVYVPDVLIGLRAVAEVQARGHELHFVHAGRVQPKLDLRRLATEAGLREDSVHLLGYLPLSEQPALLRRGTVLIQPGSPSDFNRLRLPAKLQAYLSSGTPTVTFAVGFGELLEDGQEVLKTHTDDPGELADRLEQILDDRDLRFRLSAGGPQAAARLFDMHSNAAALIAHYRQGLAP